MTRNRFKNKLPNSDGKDQNRRALKVRRRGTGSQGNGLSIDPIKTRKKKGRIRRDEFRGPWDGEKNDKAAPEHNAKEQKKGVFLPDENGSCSRENPKEKR